MAKPKRQKAAAKGETPEVPAVKDTPAWPAFTVERWPIERVVPFARNARTHSPKQIEQLRASLREFGWTMPLLARDDGTLIAGHGRFAAAKLEGYREVPVIIATGWSEKQCRAYALADNRIAINSGWDTEILGLELTDLHKLGAELDLLGFTDKELSRLLPDLNLSEGSSPEITFEPAFQVLIECRDEAEQLALLERLQKDGVKCRALIA